MLNFLAKNPEVGTFIQTLGGAIHDQLQSLSEARHADHVALLAHVETKLANFAQDNYLAIPNPALNVIGSKTIEQISKTAREATFASKISEAVHLQKYEMVFMHSSELEYLQPGEQLSDRIIDLTFKMMKEDSYYAVECAMVEMLQANGHADFGDQNDGDAQNGYIVPIHIEIDDDNESHDNDNDMSDDNDSKQYDDVDVNLQHHFVLGHIRRSSPLPAQQHTAHIYDSMSGCVSNDQIEKCIRKALPSEADVDFTFPKVPQQKDSHSCGIHAILHGISIMLFGQRHQLDLNAEEIAKIRHHLM